jgi:hypothetical protein
VPTEITVRLRFEEDLLNVDPQELEHDIESALDSGFYWAVVAEVVDIEEV